MATGSEAEEKPSVWTQDEIERILKNMADETLADYQGLTDEEAEDLATD
jgi:Flp pilus assembly CpaE family ATPase